MKLLLLSVVILAFALAEGTKSEDRAIGVEVDSEKPVLEGSTKLPDPKTPTLEGSTKLTDPKTPTLEGSTKLIDPKTPTLEGSEPMPGESEKAKLKKSMLLRHRRYGYSNGYYGGYNNYYYPNYSYGYSSFYPSYGSFGGGYGDMGGFGGMGGGQTIVIERVYVTGGGFD